MKNYNKTKKTQTAQKSKQLDAIEHLKLFIPDLLEDLVINGNLNLADKIIKILPDNLTINGNLDLTGCDNLGELPLNLTVNGNFSMDSSINGMLLRPCTKIKGNFYKHWYECLLRGYWASQNGGYRATQNGVIGPLSSAILR